MNFNNNKKRSSMKNCKFLLILLVGLFSFMAGNATNYYYNAATPANDITNKANWYVNNTTYNGGNPSSFTTGNTYIISGIGASVTITGAFNLGGGTLQVGDGTNACTFTIPSGFAVTGTVAVSALATLSIANATNPTLGTLNATSKVIFSGTGSQTVPSATYGLLSITNTTATVSAGGNITIALGGGINIISGATLDMLGYTLTNSATANYVNYTSAGGIQPSSNLVYLSATNASIAVGQPVTNQYITEGTTVSAVTTPAAASSTTSSTGTTNPIVATSITGTIVIGMPVTGTNIQANTFVTGVSGTSITLSKAPTATVTGTITYSTFTQVTLTNNASASTPTGYANANTYFLVFGAATSGNGTLKTACPTTTSATPITASKIWSFAVNYYGSAAQTIPTGTYSSLTNSNTSAIVSASGGITVNNVLTLLDGSTLNMGGQAFTCGGAQYYSNFSTSFGTGGTGTGILSTTNTSGSGAINSNYNSYTWNFTVQYAGSSSQTTSKGSQTYINFTSANTSASGVGLYTSATVTGTLTINSGCTLSVGTTQWLYGNFTPSGTGILSLASTTSLQTAASKTFTFEVDYNGTSNQTVVAGNFSTLNATGPTTTTSTASTATTNPIVVASATNIAVGQVVTGTYIQPGTTVTTVSGVNITLSLAPNAPASTAIGTVNFIGTRTLGTGTIAVSTSFIPGISNSYTVSSSNTLSLGYTGTLPTLGSNYPSYYNLSITSGNVTAGNNIAVSNGLNINSSATLDMAAFTLTVSSNSNYVQSTSAGGLQPNSNIVYLSAANASIAVGQPVTNQYITEGTTVSAVTTPAAASSSTSSTGTTNPIVATSVTGTIVVGMPVTGTNIPTNTIVTNVSGTSITLSKAPTATVTGTITYSTFTQVTLSNNASASTPSGYANTNTYFLVFGAATSGNGTLKTACPNATSATPISAKIYAFTVIYNGTAPQTIPSGCTFSNLTNSNTNGTATNTTNIVSAGGGFTVNNVLTIVDFATIDMGTNIFTPGASMTTSNGGGSNTGTGRLRTSNTGSTALNTNFVVYTWNFAVEFAGTTDQKTCRGIQNFTNLIVNTQGTLALYTGFNISGTLTINNGSIVSTGINSSAITGNFTTSGTGKLNTQNTSSTPLTANRNYSFEVDYNSPTGGQTIVAGNYTILNAGTFTTNTATTGAVTSIVVADANGIQVGHSVTGTYIQSSTTVTAVTGTTITLSLASNAASGTAIGTVTFAGTGTTTLASGTVAVSSSFIPGISNSYTVSSGNTLSLGYTTSLPTLGTNNPNLFNFAVTGGTVTAPSTLTIGGSFSISGGTFTAPSGNFNVAGNWSNTGGTFTHNSGTVVLNGTSQVLTGATTFYNFTKSVVTAATLTLPAGQTQTFAGTLSLNGATGQLLTIASSTGNTVASINPTATNIYNVAVSYNTNTSGTTINATNSNDNGNNSGWGFVAASTWTGANSTNWNDANNWSPTGVPASGAIVTITTGGSNNLAIEVSPTVASLTISSGNTVTLNGGNTLTISGVLSNSGTFNAASGSTVIVSGISGVSGVGTTTFNNLTINSGASLTGGIFSIAGTFSNNGTYNASGGTVTFNGAAAQTAPTGTYYNLSISNTAATVSAAGNIIVSNGINIANGATFDMATYQLTNNGTNYVSYTSGGGLQNSNTVNLATVNANIAVGQSVSNLFIPEGTTVSSVSTPLGATSTTSSTGTSNPIVATAVTGTIIVGQPVSGTNIPSNTFVTNVSGTSITLSKAPTGTITGTITFSSFTQVTLSTNATATIGNTNTYFIVFGAATSGNGTLNIGCPTTTSATPITANKIWAFAVNYNGTAPQSIPTGSTFSSLTNSNTSGTVSSASMTVNNMLTLLDGATIDMGTGIFSCGGNTDYTNFSTSNGGGTGTGKLSTKNTTGSGAIKSNYNTYTWNFTVEYAAASSQSTSQGAQNYKNFISANTSGVGLYTSANVSGTVTINAGCRLSVSTTQSLSGSFATSGTGILTTANPSGGLTTGRTYTFEVDYTSASSQTVVAGTYSGNLTLTGGDRTLASGIISIGGVFTPGAGIINTNGGTINFNGTGAQTIPAFNYNNLTISGARTINTNVTFASGTIGIAGVFTPSATFSGTGKFDAGSSTVSFNSTTIAQSIPVFSFNNLTINNTFGTTTLAGAVTANGLTLTSGVLALSTNNLTLASGASVSVTSGSFINATGTGVLIRNSVGNVATLFPIGTSTTYTPITITNTGGTSDLSVNLQPTLANAPGDPTQVANLQWNVLGSAATTATVQFQFNGANLPVGFLTNSTCEIGTYKTSYVATACSNSGSNGVGTPLGSNPYTVSAAGFTIPTSGTNYYVVGNSGNVVVLATTWVGSAIPADNSWTNAANWSNGVPNSNVDVVIPAVGSGIYPVLSSSQSVKNLTIGSNASLTLNAANLTSTLSFVNNGTVKGAGTIILAGSSAQTISGTGIVSNLTLNNSAGATVYGILGVTGILTLQSGLLTTNGKLTLKSTSITNSGVLAPYGVSGNSGTISGTVTVERYIPQGFRAYRDMAPQVYGAGSIFNNWQEGGSVSSTTGIFITGAAPDPTGGQFSPLDYTTQVNASTPNPAPNSNGLDYSLNGIFSAYNFDNLTGSWNSGITNTKTTNLDPFQGVRVLIRGARDFNLYKTPVNSSLSGTLDMMDATTLRATGYLVTGDVTINTTNASGNANGTTRTSSLGKLNSTNDTSFSMVANPYVCPVDWSVVHNNSTGLNASYWYLDPTTSSTGGYWAYNSASGSSVLPATVFDKSGASSTYNLIAPSGYIQAGQAFFVQNQASQTPTLKITESAKVASSTKLGVFGTSAPLSKIYLSLLKNNAGKYSLLDGAAAAFSSNFTNTYGAQDAKKLSGSSDNLFITDKGRNLSIDGRLPATASDILPISLSSLSGTDYKLVVNATNYTANGFAPYLVDAYSKTNTVITGIDTIAFTAKSSVAATFQNRFSIIFKPTTLAVNSIVATAIVNGNVANIMWNSVGEKGISNYEVEKSTDRTFFSVIAQQSAKNTATASYNATDKDLVTTTFYRIKAISKDGTIAYSNVVKVTYNFQPTTYNLFPNPLTGKTLNVQLGNVVAGKFVVSIYNSLGQKIAEQVINHAGGNGTHAINIESAVAKGVYNVVIKELNSKEQVFQSTLSVQ